MDLLRYVLMAATLSLLGLFSYHPTEQNWLLWLAIVIGCVLNLVYLLCCPPGIPKSPSRLRKLVSLWMDAKERELRDRAGKS